MPVVSVYFSKYENEFHWLANSNLYRTALVFTCYDAPYQIRNVGVINVADKGSFSYQFQSAIDYILSKFDQNHSFVFLGIGDFLVSDLHIAKGIGVNRITETTILNTLFNILLDRRRPAGTYNLERDFKRAGFIVGFLGAYTWSYNALLLANVDFTPNKSIWFIVRYLKNLSKSDCVELIKGNYVIRKVEEDKVIGTSSHENIVKRYDLCAELFTIVGCDGSSFVVPKIQLFKFRLKLMLKYQILLWRKPNDM